MFLLYDVLRCLSNCFKHLQIFYIVLYVPYFISVFFEIFKKKILNLWCGGAKPRPMWWA